MTVNPNPSVSVDDEEICAGDDATLTANPSGGTPGYTYEWSTGATTQSITVSPGSDADYSVTVTDSKGCTASTTATVTVNPNPTVSVDDVTICDGDDATLTANPSGGTPPYSYAWSTGATTVSITVSPSSTTPYSVTVTDSKGCTASTSANAIVNDNLDVTVDDVEVCEGEEGTLLVDVNGGTSPYTYSWSGPVSGSTTIAAATYDIENLPAGDYDITVVDDKGCSATTSASVIANPNPTVSVDDEEICDGDDATLTANPSGGTAGYTYEWSTGATTQSITVSPGSDADYSVTVTDSKGCTASTTATVTVNPNPSVSIDGDLEICDGEETTLEAIASGGTPGYTYEWSTGETSVSITVDPNTDTDYSVTITDSKGCTASTTETVIVNPNPSVSVDDQEILRR